MPIYEYHCLACERDFDLVETMQEHGEDRSRRCPECGSDRVQARPSAFFAKTSRKS